MRSKINEALKAAQKQQHKRRVSTLRLVNAAIGDRDIALRGQGKEKASDEDVVDLLARMIKQREESARLYKEGGRSDLEAQENEEIAIIREFLPQQMSAGESADAVARAIGEVGATSLRDMGKVMAFLREHHRGQLDMAQASAHLKKLLGAGA
jgi:uncharacterized protein YqeY